MARSDALLRLTSRLIARRDALRRSLTEEVGRLREPSRIVGHSDQLDAAVDAADAEISSRLAEIESRELVEIEQALQRIAAGRYGRCGSCGGKIPAMRLNILPCTTRCIACQRADEGQSRPEARRPAAEAWPSLGQGSEPDGNGGSMDRFDEFSVRIDCTV